MSKNPFQDVGYSGYYPNDSVGVRIKISGRQELGFDEFKEKIDELSKDTKIKYVFKDHQNYGNSVHTDEGVFIYNKGFVVISEDELLYIHDNTLWSYKFELM